jgi:hypothetical protein
MGQYGSYDTRSFEQIRTEKRERNSHLPPQVLDFKDRRHGRTIASTLAGGALGALALGPPGAVVGALGAYATAKSVGKHRERRLLQSSYKEGSGHSQAVAAAVEQGIVS